MLSICHPPPKQDLCIALYESPTYMPNLGKAGSKESLNYTSNSTDQEVTAEFYKKTM